MPSNNTNEPVQLYEIVDLKIFSLENVKYAAYLISDEADVEILSSEENRVKVKIEPYEDLPKESLVRLWKKSLIKASVDSAAFESSAPIRNLLAESVMSITTDTQKMIRQLTKQMAEQSASESVPNQKSKRITGGSAENGLLIEIDGVKNLIKIKLAPETYFLPDIFWVLDKMEQKATADISHDPGIALDIVLRPLNSSFELEKLKDSFLSLIDCSTNSIWSGNV